jgi:hypothetical protein
MSSFCTICRQPKDSHSPDCIIREINDYAYDKRVFANSIALANAHGAVSEKEKEYAMDILDIPIREDVRVPEGIAYIINDKSRILHREVLEENMIPKEVRVTRFKTTGKWYEENTIVLPPHLRDDWEIHTYLRQLRTLNQDEMYWLVETQPPRLITD